MKKIGVEEGLTNVANFLTDKGYFVKTLSGPTKDMSSLENLNAIVVSGLDTNMFGYSNTKIKTPIINANGLTPQKVEEIIDRQISR